MQVFDFTRPSAEPCDLCLAREIQQHAADSTPAPPAPATGSPGFRNRVSGHAGDFASGRGGLQASGECSCLVFCSLAHRAGVV